MSCVNFKIGNHAKGFSLVEVMVGMTLGLLVVFVIMQAFSAFENQKRTTTAGSDAQENGLMSLVVLEQAVRSAGVGLVNDAVFNCTTLDSQYNGTVPAPGIPATGGLPGPVVIADASGVADTVTVSGGTNFLGSIPVTLTSGMPQPSAELNVSRTAGFVDGQLILVLQGNQCTVMQVSQVQDAALKVQHNPGGGYPYNPSGSFYNTHAWPTYTTGAIILPFGNIASTTYSVNDDRNLHVRDNASNVDIILVKDIVSLQAQYGVSSAVGVQDVSAWVDATAGTEWASNALDSAHVKRIKAVRITVVARSSKKEAGNVTNAAPGGVDISSLPDWQRYRYRVYTTIIPLRNIIWANL